MLNEIWKDQAKFNLNFRKKPEDMLDIEREEHTKDLILHSISEMDELLRTVGWKSHRKNDNMINPEHIKEELTDMFKYWISICQIWGFTPEEMMYEYWRKSMVCEQRYAEEFVMNLTGNVAVVDIDGVLANYQKGLLEWVAFELKDYASDNGWCDWYGDAIDNAQRILEVHGIMTKHLWIGSEALGISEQQHKDLLHIFRIRKGNGGLPVHDNAAEFTRKLRRQGMKVVILTSRPIDQYPNIYIETLEWLNSNGIQFDCLWWNVDKLTTVRTKLNHCRVVYAIDDDPKYIRSYVQLGVTTHWVTDGTLTKEFDNNPLVTKVDNLREAMLALD